MGYGGWFDGCVGILSTVALRRRDHVERCGGSCLVRKLIVTRRTFRKQSSIDIEEREELKILKKDFFSFFLEGSAGRLGGGTARIEIWLDSCVSLLAK
jgi:hypothetical protein